MESIAIEKKAYTMMLERISKLKNRVNNLYPNQEGILHEEWIENAELSHRLNISLRTLQSNRERGVIGFSTIGRKIYYKISDVEKLLKKNRISNKNKN
ncbi:helix-turn-helix domain-containing protein [Bacteroides thetaiotaomicron]|uniref:helix-turn-helix domain-containing protein n=1 Tax=Bacteroides thetaiotaomicron TaxID=818 RepID=UPI0024C83013|nr:MAG: helix-turn-helix domain-containing protein [Bacteroides ovatus]